MSFVGVNPGKDSEDFQKLGFRLKAASGAEKAKKELILGAKENGYFGEGLEDE